MPLHDVILCRKMKLRCNVMCWIVFLCLFVTVCAKYDRDYTEGLCGDMRCVGVEYQCIEDRCYCAPGFIPNHFQVRCIKCPGLGEKCYGQCCNGYDNDSLHCWQGVCQPCYDSYGNWICRDNIKELLLISSAQVAMGAALVLGIIATFVLLYKLCAATNIRPLGDRSTRNTDSRLSVGSLQLYIDERLRDAPPRYTRGATAGSAVYPATTYLNSGFVHDSSIPPPPYIEEVKTEEQNTQNTTVHI